MRRNVPIALAAVVGTILIVQYFNPALYDIYEMAFLWLPIIAGIVAYLGILSFWRHHWMRAKRKSSDWLFSAVALTAFSLMVITGLWGEIFGVSLVEDPPDWRNAGPDEPRVAIQDYPNDPGGQVALQWKVSNRVGDIRAFEVRRRKGDEEEFAVIGRFEANEDTFALPPRNIFENPDEDGEPLPSVVQNGGFEDGLEGWTVEDGVRREENDYKGGHAVLPAGASLTSPVYAVGPEARFRLSGVARSLSRDAALVVRVVPEGGGEPVREFRTEFPDDEWRAAVPGGLSNDVLPAWRAAEPLRVRLRFAAEGGEVALDRVAFRPVEVEFRFRFDDRSPFGADAEYDFPRYGERTSILTVNPSFDVSLDGWTGPDATRVPRTDREGKYCARIPAGSTLVSSVCDRVDDPMGQRLRYRFRGWGRGVGAPLSVEIVVLDEAGGEIGAESVEWPADSGWSRKELTILPDDAAAAFRLRYTALGTSGHAEADGVELLPVKVDPAPGVDYVYRVVALDADGNPLGEPFEETISGDQETIGSYKSPVGAYAWLFQNLLVPMEATMFALLAFFIASAAFRAFRARSLEASLLLGAAILVMIGRVPLGEFVWSGFGDIADWIMRYPNGASKRAIMIGVGLGMAATSLKLMLGIERAYLGRKS